MFNCTGDDILLVLDENLGVVFGYETNEKKIKELQSRTMWHIAQHNFSVESNHKFLFLLYPFNSLQSETIKFLLASSYTMNTYRNQRNCTIFTKFQKLYCCCTSFVIRRSLGFSMSKISRRFVNHTVKSFPFKIQQKRIDCK